MSLKPFARILVIDPSRQKWEAIEAEYLSEDKVNVYLACGTYAKDVIRHFEFVEAQEPAKVPETPEEPESLEY